MPKGKGPNKRLEREPEYNSKRRIGTGTPHREICPTCHFAIPDDATVTNGTYVPCSDDHVRCVRCQWPVAKDHLLLNGLCVLCVPENIRRNYYRLKSRSKEMMVLGKQQQETDDDQQEEVEPCNDSSHLQS